MRKRAFVTVGLAMGVGATAIGARAASIPVPPPSSLPKTNQNSGAARPPGVSAAEAADQLQRSGGSLMKASINAQSDPQRARLSDVSFFAVPEPEPRILRKHDLVTIII
ncbi:MAG: hypothetical protein ACREJC_03130, partial [Tepidisphaeraceae bacterium]